MMLSICLWVLGISFAITVLFSLLDTYFSEWLLKALPDKSRRQRIFMFLMFPSVFVYATFLDGAARRADETIRDFIDAIKHGAFE